MSQWIFKQSARSVSCRQDGLFKADLKLALLAAQELKNLPPVSGCLQAKQNLMLSLREHKNGLLSALPHAVGLVKRDINVPMRANASALGRWIDLRAPSVALPAPPAKPLRLLIKT